tara:strand:+ start:340 stop:705 length:366 start_codon:yes stop_codon:yes gene_type:complete
MNKKCPVCNQLIKGRSDKRFCSGSCKNSYHYEKRQDTEAFYLEVDKQLKTNRKILKAYNKKGFSTVKKEELLKEGFNPKYFTHYWKNKKDDVYLFVYDFGFMNLKNEKKYLIVNWQPYMKK